MLPKAYLLLAVMMDISMFPGAIVSEPNQITDDERQELVVLLTSNPHKNTVHP